MGPYFLPKLAPPRITRLLVLDIRGELPQVLDGPSHDYTSEVHPPVAHFPCGKEGHLSRFRPGLVAIGGVLPTGESKIWERKDCR